MSKNTTNLAASVKQRLHNYAKIHGEDFNLVQVRFATERLLYRLSVSKYKDAFYLKGAMLFVLWENRPHRPTRDMDLLFLWQQDTEELSEVFSKVVSLKVEPDGLIFDSSSIRVSQIREDNAYGGIRVKLTAFLGSGRIPLQVDVGLGDSVYPQPEWAELGTILDFPSPRIRPYPIYTVVAEKFQAMVELAEANSRMKDYYDIHYLLQNFHFDGNHLQEAIRQTFQRRKTEIPQTIPVGLSRDFATDQSKQTQWRAFLRKNQLVGAEELPEIVAQIADFLMPILSDAEITGKRWTPDEGWGAKENG